MNMLSVAQVAKQLNVSTYTVRRLILTGHIRAVNIGARVVVGSAELERLMTSGTGPKHVKKLSKSHRKSTDKSGAAAGLST
jgi:excisionase family DNA binding protein